MRIAGPRPWCSSSGVTQPMPACSHTVLENGDLRSSYLRRDDPTGVSPRGARANASTGWPDGFDWRRAGVVMDDEPTPIKP